MSINADAVSEFESPEPELCADPASPVVPEADAFYLPPSGWQATAPGHALRVRPVSIAAFGLVRQPVTAWQVLYRTSDLHARPDTTVATIMLPPGYRAGADNRVISYQVAMDSISSRYFPSHAFRLGARRALGAATQPELLLILAALARGHVVCVSDHGGMLGGFAAPREPGYRTLDGLRAALSLRQLGLPTDCPIGLLGYSGGGMATAWAAEMAPTYAPELNIVGVVAGSPVGNPGSVVSRRNKSAAAGLPTMAIASLRRLYPALDDALRANVDARRRRVLDSMPQRSTVYALCRLAYQDFDRGSRVTLAELLAQPSVAEVLEDLRLGKHIPTAPIFVLQSVLDQVISVDDVDEQVRRYVAGGAHVTYLRDVLSEHTLLAVTAVPLMFAWLEDRFAGRALPEPGTRTVVTIMAERGVIAGLLALVRLVCGVLLGRPFGRDRGPLPRP